MEFQKILLEGAFLVKLKRLEDERGYFGAYFFVKMNLEITVWNLKLFKQYVYKQAKGTLRGMHYQNEPYQETNLFVALEDLYLTLLLT